MFLLFVRIDEYGLAGYGHGHMDLFLSQGAQKFNKEAGIEGNIHRIALVLTTQLLTGFVGEIKILGGNGQTVVGQSEKHLIGGAVGEDVDPSEGTEELGATDVQYIFIIDRDDSVEIWIRLVDQAADHFCIFKTEESV